jgi:hypothetical protein
MDATEYPDDEIKNLCDKGFLANPPGVCVQPDLVLGKNILLGMIPNHRVRAVTAELTRLSSNNPEMRVFVFGHTHVLQCTSVLAPEGGVPVQVANSGAFQRLIDEKKFLEAASKAGLSSKPSLALRRLKLEQVLPACYTAVLIRLSTEGPVATVKNWYMEETGGAGEFVDPWDCRCAKLGAACDETGVPCEEQTPAKRSRRHSRS